MRALWAVLAFVCTRVGLELVIEGVFWLVAPHRLINPYKVKSEKPLDLTAKVFGRVGPAVPAARLAVGLWLLGVAGWLVAWGVL